MRIVYIINTIRFLILILSLFGLGCHAAQCALLKQYQNITHIPSWIQAGHWQYLAWFVSLGLSTFSAAALCVYGCCCRRKHMLRGDRILGVLNPLPLLTSILTALLADGPEPWTNGIVNVDRPTFSFVSYCSHLRPEVDVTYPLLYNRCLLSDGTWISATGTCVFWILLAVLAFATRSTKPSVSHSEQATMWEKYVPGPSSSQCEETPYTTNQGSMYDDPNHFGAQSSSAPIHRRESATYADLEPQPTDPYHAEYPPPTTSSSHYAEKVEVEGALRQRTPGGHKYAVEPEPSNIPSHYLPQHHGNGILLHQPSFDAAPYPHNGQVYSS